jgi:hypothetical protein
MEYVVASAQLTGVAVERRLGWCNTVVGCSATIEVEVLEPAHWPVRLETDVQEVTDIVGIKPLITAIPA